MKSENGRDDVFKVIDSSDPLNQNEVYISLGSSEARIATCKWSRDENGEINDIGVRQTITMPRAELIGIAYEILNAVK
jgi:hypothetical protein